VDPNVAIGAVSLVFTIVGSVAGVLAIRQTGGPPPIKIAGTVDPKPAFRLLESRHSAPRHAMRTMQILARYVFVSHNGRVIVGALDQFEISLFLDLFSACTHPPYRRSVAKLIVGHIRHTNFPEPPTHVAVPKEGNVLLADEVARRMKLSLLVVRTMVPAIRFGDPVEGMVAAGACVVIVDDIAYDGELLVRTVAGLRAHGARVTNCFCAVERMDGNGRERLGQHHVNLHAPIQIDEGTLRDLAHLPPEHGQTDEPGPAVPHR
jgi:orotate phosphoribosyltransferase